MCVAFGECVCSECVMFSSVCAVGVYCLVNVECVAGVVCV